MESEDRNVRVAMLRVLAFCEGDNAASGILRGLRDPKRRVREVAAKSARHFVDHPEVVAALRRMVEDELEKLRIRSIAFEVLAGMRGLPYDDAELKPALDALAHFARLDAYRAKVIRALARRPLDDASRSLLEEIVSIGAKDEAVMATRVLLGAPAES